MADAKETAGLHGQPAGVMRASRRLLEIGTLFYFCLLAIAIGWRWIADAALPWRAPEALGAWPLSRRVFTGLATGAGLIAVSRLWTAHSRAGRELAAELASAVAGLTLRQALWLAALSGLAEEAFFRGALQPRVGWLVASLLFGLAHFHPRRELRVWSLSAGLAGLGFGALFQASGDLLAPALAHATLNAVNLRWLARSGARSDPP